MAKYPKIPEKAYNNKEFLNSPEGRIIRILSEYIEPHKRFRKEKVKDTIVFFGSARLKSKLRAQKILAQLVKSKAPKEKIHQANIDVEMSRYYEDAVELSYLLTCWSKKLKPDNRFVICSGGGPGVMEAANRGARKAKGLSMGLNISLPFEQFPNKYITRSLNLEFHYFFMRKFWFAYLAKALVIMPGGYGTLDEFFELLTLVQTKKIKKKMPIILYDSEFWNGILNLSELHRKGMIAHDDLNLFKIVNTPQEAFEYLRDELSKHYINIDTTLLDNKKL
ncbi:MAG: TIGR00730 family Rossman fold protein [Ignavibacteriae bacterium]|nr:MAG: TIGR00730 family Rossman fold protein [Ignavibacteriota bacterium]